jgi:hypothetical protein
MEAGWNMLLPKGILGMINLPSWLFLSSFEKLREKLIKEKHIDSLLHMGRGIFGVDWGSTAFIIQNQLLDKDSNYFKLHKRNFQHLYPEDIQQIFLKAKNDPSTKINFDKYREGDGTTSVEELVDMNGIQISYLANQKDFEKIPGSPIGYWLDSNFVKKIEKSKKLDSFGKATKGLDTCDNERFVRIWNEVDFRKFSTSKSDNKWMVYQKGGDFQKWYGNNEKIVDWENDGYTIKNFRNSEGKIKSRPQNIARYFSTGITWSAIGSNKTSYRLLNDSIFGGGGNGFFPKSEYINFILGFLNSSVSAVFLKLYNPTLNNLTGDIHKLPIFLNADYKLSIDKSVNEIIDNSKNEWNSKELSWGFNRNQLIYHKSQDLEETYELYQQFWQNKFFQLHKNEEELNRKFIEIYGLQEELTPDVPLEDITILKEETVIENGQLIFKVDEVFAQFMSYAVGCMFGRYSLDKEGLILANQGETLEDYLKKVALSEPELTFKPDDDNVIPVLDDEWFEDDIVGRFYAFLKASFGKENFDKNLAFVEDCLGKDVRKYFVKDFYADHIKRYKKRPIYWMFSSPKGSFNVLIYMHRYTPDTLNKILNNYLIQYREKLNTRIEHLEHIIVTGTSAEQTRAQKEKDKLKLVILELVDYERDVLRPLAIERISIDLDDGVLVNYNKFGKAIKDVAGLNDAKTKKKVREFDWIDVTEIR